MKRLTPIILASCLLATSGCISAHVVNKKAKPHVDYDEKKKEAVEVAGQPAY